MPDDIVIDAASLSALLATAVVANIPGWIPDTLKEQPAKYMKLLDLAAQGPTTDDLPELW
jgi:hypothetical protein